MSGRTGAPEGEYQPSRVIEEPFRFRNLVHGKNASGQYPFVTEEEMKARSHMPTVSMEEPPPTRLPANKKNMNANNSNPFARISTNLFKGGRRNRKNRGTRKNRKTNRKATRKNRTSRR
jgi:hypothetical protein